MTKTTAFEYHRLYLIESLPEPIEPKSAHLQIFDNYIEGTRLRLRLLRDPATRDWTRVLQQHITVDADNPGITKLAEMFLNDAEYSNFEQFEGREIRKNRYFHEFDGVGFAFDVYLGDLWGLHTARVEFGSEAEMRAFEPPPFAVFDVTSDRFFVGKHLVGKKFEDVRARVQQIGATVPPSPLTNEDL